MQEKEDRERDRERERKMRFALCCSFLLPYSSAVFSLLFGFFFRSWHFDRRNLDPVQFIFGCHACSFCAVGIFNEAIYNNLILSSVCAIVLHFFCLLLRFTVIAVVFVVFIIIIVVAVAVLTVQLKTMFNTRLQQIINPCMIKCKVNTFCVYTHNSPEFCKFTRCSFSLLHSLALVGLSIFNSWFGNIN